jgi:FkbM family methyltransferase
MPTPLGAADMLDHHVNRTFIGRMTDSLKRLTYRPAVSRLVWRLHLAGILRTGYYCLNRPRGNIVHTRIGGIDASFYVRTPWELRSLDPAGDMGREQHVLEKLASLVRPGDVVFDVGSNFGIYTILLAKAAGSAGTLVAFEPEAQAYGHLQDNVELNSLTNVKTFQLALGDRAREEKLFLQYTGASRLERSTVVQGGYEVVTVVEGDDLVSTENLPVPRVVKIDVEGHEWAVIRGLRKTLAMPECEVVCCEIHPPLLPTDTKTEHVLDFLKSLGFNQIENLQRGTSEFHAFARKG